MQTYHLTQVDCFPYSYNVFIYVKNAHFLTDDIFREKKDYYCAEKVCLNNWVFEFSIILFLLKM